VSAAEPAPDVHVVYWLTQHLRGDVIEGGIECLSADERARCARFERAGDRRDYAAAHVLLRRMLTAHGGRPEREWAFVTGPHGKPMLPPGMSDRAGLSFNLAHARGLVACAVAFDVEVGVDVEPAHGK
jgi:4'-phosphopantetheinyl transferase